MSNYTVLLPASGGVYTAGYDAAVVQQRQQALEFSGLKLSMYDDPSQVPLGNGFDVAPSVAAPPGVVVAPSAPSSC